jgi:5-(carboxyamino)imidazole ribonucleotide synthase
VNKRTRIGILGGGQLARMSAYQAYKMGFEIAILEKEKDSPAGQLTKHEFVGWVDNEEILKKFAESCDIITLENEFVDYRSLEFIEKLGKPVLPSSYTISLIQDKLIQKKSLAGKGIPVAKFLEVNSDSTYNNIAEKIGKKFILKSRTMGYDGYGNYKVEDENDFQEGLQKLSSRNSALLAEEFINFDKELAVMVVRTKKEIKVYPVVETIQKNHICHIVIAPADIKKKTAKIAEEIAVEAVKAVKGYGIFGVELFKAGKDVIVNEMAPRPHNSGHYTIEACVTSQFENHIRAVLGLPLGSTEMVKPNAVMVNLLGKREGEGIIENYPMALKNENIHVHLYGKALSRIGRKMGHITILGNDAAEILKIAKKTEEKIIL